MKTQSRLMLTVLAGAVLLAMTGCDKLTRSRYELIRVQIDTKDDVERLIGDPTHALPTRWHYERMDKHLEVFVDFNEDDIVTRKQWIDAGAAEWDDSAPPTDEPVYERTTIRRVD